MLVTEVVVTMDIGPTGTTKVVVTIGIELSDVGRTATTADAGIVVVIVV